MAKFQLAKLPNPAAAKPKAVQPYTLFIKEEFSKASGETVKEKIGALASLWKSNIGLQEVISQILTPG
jgi:hypothetical protein